MSLYQLQGLLDRRKRSTTNHITQAIHNKRTGPQWRNNPWKLLRQEIRRTNIPANLPRHLLPFHPETVNEPHFPLLKEPFQCPAVHTHLPDNILPRPARSEIDSRPTIQQALVHYLLRTRRHPRISLAEKQDNTPAGQTAQ